MNSQQTSLRSLRVAGALACLASLLPGVAFAEVRYPELRVDEFAIATDGYVEVEGVLAGVVHRDDGSRGTYEVPVWLSYPDAIFDCNGTGIVDVVNSVLYETFPEIGTSSAATESSSSYTNLLPHAYGQAVATADNAMFAFGALLLGHERFLRHASYGGYVYTQIQWNKLVIDRQRAFGTLPSPSLHIERGSDGYFILRDISLALREADFRVQPAPGVPAPPAVCTSDDVVAFGHSQTGQLLREFSMFAHNSSLANDAAFDDGLVFEGSVHSGGGAGCRSMQDVEPFYAYDLCPGATPSSEGHVLTINTETDVQMLNAVQARQGLGSSYLDHYRAYEIAGVAHIPDTSDDPQYNHVDISPVYRSLTDKLVTWLQDPSAPPPAPVFLTAAPRSLSQPLFSDASWGSHEPLMYMVEVGGDGNAVGGIRLVHLDSTPDGWKPLLPVGAPLGIYRGTGCLVDPLTPRWQRYCLGLPDEAIYEVNSGTFTAYTDVPGGSSFCSNVGEQPGIRAAAERAAQVAVNEGWVLSEDATPMVERHVQLSAQLLGCAETPLPTPPGPVTPSL